MDWHKVKHACIIALGLLTAFAGIVHQGSLADKSFSPGWTFGMLAGLVLVALPNVGVVLGRSDDGDVALASRLLHGASTLAGFLFPVVMMLQSHFSAGSQSLVVLGYVATFLGDVSKAGGALTFEARPKIGMLVLLAALLVPATSRADAVPDDVSPPLSHCFGSSTTCVVPDVGLPTMDYDLVAKKWRGGIRTASVGYALLFASDSPYASGIAVRASFSLDQSSPSSFAPTLALVLCHYLEVGYTPVLGDGKIDHLLSVGVNLNAEAVLSTLVRRSLGERLLAARATERTRVAEPTN